MTNKLFTQKSVDFILNCCKSKKGKIHIALSGGDTPEETYKLLGKRLPSNAVFHQIDERYVPLTHKDSNYKMITQYLPLHHFFDTSLPIKECLKKYESGLPKKFDLIILGVGPDGHTASLFPNSLALKSHRPAAHTRTKNFAGFNRLTLTFPPILNSKKLLILLKNKPEILKKLQQKNMENVDYAKFPAAKLLTHKDLTILSC